MFNCLHYGCFVLKFTAPCIVEWYLLIRPEKISWLRFILEGYDGLAVLSTLSAKNGLVRIQTLQTRLMEVMRLLEALSPDLTQRSPSPFK